MIPQGFCILSSKLIGGITAGHDMVFYGVNEALLFKKIQSETVILVSYLYMKASERDKIPVLLATRKALLLNCWSTTVLQVFVQ